MSTGKQQINVILDSSFELKADMQSLSPAPIPVPPTMDSVLAKIGPLPHEALFLGVASDGLPVLLNVYDPVSGPLLVLGEAGAGKTAFLKSIAQALTQTHAPENLQYGIVTEHPDEWDISTKHCDGLFLAHQEFEKS